MIRKTITIFLEACPDSPFARLADRRRIQSLNTCGAATQTPSADAAINPARRSRHPRFQAPTVSAPTPSNRPASGGFQLELRRLAPQLSRTGLYVRKIDQSHCRWRRWRHHGLTVISIDPASQRPPRRTLAWSNGLFGQGPLARSFALDGRLVDPVRLDRLRGHRRNGPSRLKSQPPTMPKRRRVRRIFSHPAGAGNPNGDQTGRFELRYANQP